jgi:hypothetical protein
LPQQADAHLPEHLQVSPHVHLPLFKQQVQPFTQQSALQQFETHLLTHLPIHLQESPQVHLPFAQQVQPFTQQSVFVQHEAPETVVPVVAHLALQHFSLTVLPSELAFLLAQHDSAADAENAKDANTANPINIFAMRIFPPIFISLIKDCVLKMRDKEF